MNFEPTSLEDRILAAAQILQRGGTVAFPTETVYGLGANALDSAAVARIFAIKARPRFNPLIVHVASLEAAARVVAEFPPAAQALAKAFWPGPLTLVLPKTDRIPELVTGGLGTVGLRIPRHPIALALLRAAGIPVAAPSANRFGEISPTLAKDVYASLGDAVDQILDGGQCDVGLESTIVGFAGNTPVLLRPGGLAREALEAIVGPLARPAASEGVLAPGMLLRHYAPRTPLYLAAADARPRPGDRVGLLTLQAPTDAEAFAGVEILSPTADLEEAATRLFQAMRRLDHQAFDYLLARPIPKEGLGEAIADRLARAAEGKHWV